MVPCNSSIRFVEKYYSAHAVGLLIGLTPLIFSHGSQFLVFLKSYMASGASPPTTV